MSRTMVMFALLIAGILAACGGSSNTGGTGGADGSMDAGGGTTDTGGGITDALYSSPEMESLLPTNVDGMAFTISSFDYSKIPLDQAAMSFGDASLEGWLGGSSFNMGDGATTANLGGKTVQKVAYPGLPTVFYQWVKGDTLYWVVAGPESFGDAVVSATK